MLEKAPHRLEVPRPFLKFPWRERLGSNQTWRWKLALWVLNGFWTYFGPKATMNSPSVLSLAFWNLFSIIWFDMGARKMTRVYRTLQWTVHEGPISFRSDSVHVYKTCAKGKLRLNRKLLFPEISLSTGLSSNISFLSKVLNQIDVWLYGDHPVCS